MDQKLGGFRVFTLPGGTVFAGQWFCGGKNNVRAIGALMTTATTDVRQLGWTERDLQWRQQ